MAVVAGLANVMNTSREIYAMSLTAPENPTVAITAYVHSEATERFVIAILVMNRPAAARQCVPANLDVPTTVRHSGKWKRLGNN